MVNRFQYKNTAIVRSELDFTRLKAPIQFSGTAHLSTSVGIPKDVDKDPTVRCTVAFTIGGDDRDIKISLKTVSVFEIQTLVDTETLREDANTICLQRSLDELSKKVAELTLIHIGTKLEIPIPRIEP